MKSQCVIEWLCCFLIISFLILYSAREHIWWQLSKIVIWLGKYQLLISQHLWSYDPEWFPSAWPSRRLATENWAMCVQEDRKTLSDLMQSPLAFHVITYLFWENASWVHFGSLSLLVCNTEIMMLPLLEEKLMDKQMPMEEFFELLRPQKGRGSKTPHRKIGNL